MKINKISKVRAEQYAKLSARIAYLEGMRKKLRPGLVAELEQGAFVSESSKVDFYLETHEKSGVDWKLQFKNLITLTLPDVDPELVAFNLENETPKKKEVHLKVRPNLNFVGKTRKVKVASV